MLRECEGDGNAGVGDGGGVVGVSAESPFTSYLRKVQQNNITETYFIIYLSLCVRGFQSHIYHLPFFTFKTLLLFILSIR